MKRPIYTPVSKIEESKSLAKIMTAEDAKRFAKYFVKEYREAIENLD
jgi:hypothetical protein